MISLSQPPPSEIRELPTAMLPRDDSVICRAASYEASLMHDMFIRAPAFKFPLL